MNLIQFVGYQALNQQPHWWWRNIRHPSANRSSHQKLHTTTAHRLVLAIGDPPDLTGKGTYSFSHVDDSFITVINWIYMNIIYWIYYTCIYTFIIHLFLAPLLRWFATRVGTTMPLTLLWDCTMPAWLFQVLWPWICLAMRSQRNTQLLLSIASNPVAILIAANLPERAPQMIG